MLKAVVLLLGFVGFSLQQRCYQSYKVECAKNDQTIEWKDFGNNSYALVKEQYWQQDAEKRCIELGGHLVSIHSKEENDFVHNLRNNNSVWIGRNKLNDPGKTGLTAGHYSWSDGTPDDLPVLWDKRQPNEPWSDCMFMANREDNFGEWSDYFCDQNPPVYYTPNPPYALCKKPKA
uniref:C-type lectin domain-containing protein n=1 Tax=Panagrolaimus davidi TaxID=227884 RepID=A0A914QNY4_9BILA